MSQEKKQATIRETGESVFAVDINVSGFSLKGDEPVDAGGGGLGPSPYDFLTAALGECTAMTIRWYAQKQGWPLERVSVEITHQKQPRADGRPGKTDMFGKRITLIGDALTAEQRGKLMEVSAKCPVQRTLEGTPVIQTVSE